MVPGRIDVDSTPVHLPAKGSQEAPVKCRCLAIGCDLNLGVEAEVQTCSCSNALHAHRETRIHERLSQAGVEPCADAQQMVIESRLGYYVQEGVSGQDR